MPFGRLFNRSGGAAASPPPPPAPPPPSPPTLDDLRRKADAISRVSDPVAWAGAQQMVADGLIQTGEATPGPEGMYRYLDAAHLLTQALEAVEGADCHPAFRGSLMRLRGMARHGHAARMDGWKKRELLALAADDLAGAAALCPPEHSRDLWVHAQFFQGACCHDLACLEEDEAALAWFDRAAAVFGDIAERGAAAGTIHPFGAYNRAMSLERRAALTPPEARRPWLEEARRSLEGAMSVDSFREQMAELPGFLARLDAALAELP